MYITRQMLIGLWSEPEACQYVIITIRVESWSVPLLKTITLQMYSKCVQPNCHIRTYGTNHPQLKWCTRVTRVLTHTKYALHHTMHVNACNMSHTRMRYLRRART